jgi:BirA family biotin operon repressor/biotin-[acetyl-CoA-carboxylase] ligase
MQYIKDNGYIEPLCFVTTKQTSGIGSRNNSWDSKDGNLFFSFVIDINLLPKDLPTQSASIYFSYIFKSILESIGSKTILKWPNDFYINSKKIGGTITKLSDRFIYCGIGLNTFKVNDSYGYLDIDINIDHILTKYFQALEKYPTWKQIISQFEIEFYKYNEFETQGILLKDTVLQDDGSLVVDGQKVFSLR